MVFLVNTYRNWGSDEKKNQLQPEILGCEFITIKWLHMYYQKCYENVAETNFKKS